MTSPTQPFGIERTGAPPGTHVGPQVSIMVHQPGLESEYETVDALRTGVTTGDLARVTEIVIHASDWVGQDSGRVYIRYGTLLSQPLRVRDRPPVGRWRRVRASGRA
jgi:hypothetical protein